MLHERASCPLASACRARDDASFLGGAQVLFAWTRMRTAHSLSPVRSTMVCLAMTQLKCMSSSRPHARPHARRAREGARTIRGTADEVSETFKTRGVSQSSAGSMDSPTPRSVTVRGARGGDHGARYREVNCPFEPEPEIARLRRFELRAFTAKGRPSTKLGAPGPGASRTADLAAGLAVGLW